MMKTATVQLKEFRNRSGVYNGQLFLNPDLLESKAVGFFRHSIGTAF
jgi:hypothetical protein